MDTSFLLFPLQPFRLDYTVWALRRRSKNNVDLWRENRYTRLFFIENQLIKVDVEQKNEQEILVSTNQTISPKIKKELVRLLEKMLGLNCNLLDFYRIAEQDPYLAPIVRQFKGLKPPRFPSIFEALVNAISCQQLSLDAGLQVQNRFIQYVGKNIHNVDETFYAFPIPKDVENCSIWELKKLGYSTNKCETLIELSSRISSDETLFHHLEDKTNNEIVAFLCQFKGIGRWSAEYILLRGLGKIDMFPGDDVGASNNLQNLLQIKTKLDYRQISQITQKWYPYAGLIYFHLLLQKLKARGLFDI
ncbi:DNA-3-methyladenine glycosylase family protein [Legionella brunensis]|uniref:DNA-3-methyladenine glycosylase II n=1 Tax=Legionella brunensis TaxID=29422 RepID=A0A0W0S097_9GAMM|nr:DNA-3-methyladenine glycosylase [Legionella brunensis]KTC76541.1 DNA-3-methyladenine glycosylase [Legionella brunensis]